MFVEPELVYGTLVEGYRIGAALPSGYPRALYQLFLVSEVRPFGDGNGRVGRATMNAELSAVGLARVIVPIVWRNEQLEATHALFDSTDAERSGLRLELP